MVGVPHRLPALARQVFLRLLLKTALATGSTEVVRLPFVVGLPLCCGRVHFHAANWIDGCHCCLLSISLRCSDPSAATAQRPPGCRPCLLLYARPPCKRTR